MFDQALEVRHVEQRVERDLFPEVPHGGFQAAVDPLLDDPEVLRRDGLARRAREVTEHRHGERIGEQRPQILVHALRRDLGLLHHEDDATEGRVHPVRHRLLRDREQPGNHFLPFVFVEVQLDHVAFERRDPVKERVEAVEEAGVRAPIGVAPQVVPCARRAPARASVSV